MKYGEFVEEHARIYESAIPQASYVEYSLLASLIESPRFDSDSVAFRDAFCDECEKVVKYASSHGYGPNSTHRPRGVFHREAMYLYVAVNREACRKLVKKLVKKQPFYRHLNDVKQQQLHFNDTLSHLTSTKPIAASPRRVVQSEG